MENPDGTSETKLVENPKLLEPRAKDKKAEIQVDFKLLGVALKFSSEQKEYPDEIEKVDTKDEEGSQ